jgi:hypothetical protein
MLAGPVTLEKRGIATALLTASREICELRPFKYTSQLLITSFDLRGFLVASEDIEKVV